MKKKKGGESTNAGGPEYCIEALIPEPYRQKEKTREEKTRGEEGEGREPLPEVLAK